MVAVWNASEGEAEVKGFWWAEQYEFEKRIHDLFLRGVPLATLESIDANPSPPSYEASFDNRKPVKDLS